MDPRYPLIFDAEDLPEIPLPSSPIVGSSFLVVLMKNGYRVLEQRFPRRAYVVIRDEGGPQPSYVVQKGGTLALIARKVYGDLAKFQLIEQANPHLRYRTLQVGERIKVPALAAE